MEAIRGYDGWRTMGPPEADEVTVDATCDCGFEGDTDGQVDGRRLTWECPECGTEVEEDADDRFGPDPDYAHDDR
jgi:hypothetical protein